MKTRVIVKLKNGVLDPQGKAVQQAAATLGFVEASDIRVGKVFEIEWDGHDQRGAKEKLEQLGNKLLANTVIEKFEIEIL